MARVVTNLGSGIDFSRHATKHRTKYIKNILGQPVHTKDDIKWYAEENDNKNPKQMRIIQSDSEYESVMPQTQLEKEKQQQNSRKGKI